MYFVHCNDSPLYDLRDEDLVLISPTVKLEENSAGSFEFTILPKHPHYDSVNELDCVISVYDNDAEIFSGRVTETTLDMYNRKKVVCEGELGFLNDSVQRPAVYHDMTVRGYLETLLNYHNADVADDVIDKTFKVGSVTVTDSNDSLYKYTNWESTWEVIKTDLLETYGGHFRIRKVDGVRYLDYLADYPNTNTQVIQFGENLLDFTNDLTAEDIATAIIPLGATLDEAEIQGLESYLTIKDVNDGKDYVYSEEAVKNYGWIYKTVRWQDVHVADNLLRKGKEYLSDIQFADMCLKVSVVDLHMLNVDTERIKILDNIRVVSAPNGLDRYFPVTEMTVYLDKPSNNKLTLGTNVDKKGMTGTAQSSNATILKRIEELPTENKILKEAQENASQLIKSATNGHVYITNNADELLIMDTDSLETANKVWRWNLNGLGYSPNGYNGDYETAITMNGQIVGKFLVGGSVSAEALSASYKSSVEKQIEDAEQNAKDDTDEKLSSYWTQVQVETAIKNSAEAVTLSAKETAISYTDSKLKNYSTSAQIKVTTNAITAEVAKKFNTSDWSTKLRVSASDIQIAWNNISKYVQFSGGALKIYDSAVTSTQKLRSKFDDDGMTFYRDGYTVGKIGTNYWKNNNAHKGLVFDLNYQGKYMTFAQMSSSGDSSYTAMLTFSRANSIYDNYGVNLGCNMWLNNYTINNAHFSGNSATYNNTKYTCYTGVIPICTNISISAQSGGGISWSYSHSKIRVSNGLIVGYWT